MGRPALGWAGVAIVASCSGGARTMATPDASVGVDAGEPPDAGPPAVEAPRIPWLADGVPPLAPPVLTPCPPGWREVRDDDAEAATCDPYPEREPEACAPGFAHFPGGAGCEPVGRPCPEGEWADALPADGTLYVRAGAPDGGDGTRDRPLGRIGDAMRAAGLGSTVALSRGTWDEVVTLRSGVTLRGACAAETVLTSSAPSDFDAVVQVEARGARLQDLRIEGAARPGLWVAGAGVVLRAEGVVVSMAQTVGLDVGEAGSLVAEGLVVRDTRPLASDGSFGRGLEVEAGASAEVTRAVLEGNRDIAVNAAGRVVLADVVVRGTRGGPSGGRALNVQGGASAEVARALLEQNEDAAVFAAHAGTTVQLEDTVVRANQSAGLYVRYGAGVEASRALFERNREVGVFAADEGSRVELRDAVVRETEGRRGDGVLGRGVNVQDGPELVVTRAVFERNRDAAVAAFGASTTARLEDVQVRDTLGRDDDHQGGSGLYLFDGASAEVARALLEHNREVAVAIRLGGSLRLEDVAVRDTDARESDGQAGGGLAVWLGASAEVTRALFERNRNVAVVAGGEGSVLALEDVVVRDTLSRASDGRSGRGVQAQALASVELTRALLERNREAGLLALAATLRATDVRVDETLQASCAPDCALGAGGVGAASFSIQFLAGALSLRRFVIRGAVLCGLQIASDGELELLGEVRESHIGACVQVPGYPLWRLNDGVRYVENGADLEATGFPAPDPSEVPEDGER